MVKHTKREDAGAYLCIANNGVPPSVSKRVQLNVRCEFGAMGCPFDIDLHDSLSLYTGKLFAFSLFSFKGIFDVKLRNVFFFFL